MAMQRYRFNLAANGHVLLMVQGTKFIVKESRGPVNIRVLQDGGFLNGLEAGQGFKGQQFKGIEITDASGLANDGYVIVSDDEFIDNRVTGEVEVIDGEKSRTLGGGGFMGSVSYGSAGNYAGLQLFNNGTTKNLIVTAISASLDVAGSIAVYGSGTILAIGAATPANALIASSTTATALLRAEAFAAWPPNPYNVLIGATLAAGSLAQLVLTRPIVVPPSEGLNIVAAPVNVNAVANFQWFEEDV